MPKDPLNPPLEDAVLSPATPVPSPSSNAARPVDSTPSVGPVTGVPVTKEPNPAPTDVPADDVLDPLLKTVEEHAAIYATADWLQAAARVEYDWPLNQLITEADYLEALDATRNLEVR